MRKFLVELWKEESGISSIEYVPAATKASAARRIIFCRSGTSSVEFVLVVPLVMLFLFGIISFGSVLYIQSNMLNAARDAVRRMVVAEVIGNGVAVHCGSETLGSAEVVACAYLATWGTNFQITATDQCPFEQDATVKITTSASSAALADVFGFFNGRTLSAKVTMRKEGACS